MRVFYKEFAKPSGMPRGLFAMSLGLGVLGLAIATIGRMQAIDPALFVTGQDGISSAPGWFGALAQGNVLPMLLDPAFWRGFPTWPRNLHALWQPESACVLLGVLAVSVFVLRCMLRRSWSLIGAAVLVSSAAPLVAAAVVPRAWLDFDYGSWLWRMLVLSAYGAGLCIGFGLLDLLRPQMPAAKRGANASPGRVRHANAVGPQATVRAATPSPRVPQTTRRKSARAPSRSPRR